MGVGTYREDYRGAGRSINVNSSSTTDEHYAAYVADEEANGEDPMDRQDFDKDTYKQENEDILDVVEAAAKSVGLVSDRVGRFSGGRVDFDREVTGIAAGDVFDVAWRSWQTDYVVAIGPSRSFGELHDGDDLQFAVVEKGRDPEALRSDYDDVLSDFESLVRLSLLREGHETSVPTSSYTSRPDEKPEDVDARIEGLVAKVKAGIAKLSKDAPEALPSLSVTERLKVAEAVLTRPEDLHGNDVKVVVATYDPKKGYVALWDPANEDGGLSAVMGLPGTMTDYARGLPVTDDGLVPLPHEPETEAWYATAQSAKRIVLSPEQYSEATMEDCVVVWRDENEKGKFVLHLVEQPTTTP